MKYFNDFDQELTDKQLTYLNEVIEDFGTIGKMMSKYFLDKIIDLIKSKSFEEVTISQFKKFDNMMGIILDFFEN